MSVVPFAAFMAGYCAFLSLARDSDVISGMSASLARLLGDGSLTAVMAAAALALAVFVSCRLSLAAYRKREF
jgi:hypothetical protein